jgi:dTDP-glucose pyrophosphorylase
MTIVIPMAGRGQRFVDAGYRQPKMLLEAHGKTLLQWSADSLPLSLCKCLVFVGLMEHEQYFSISKKLRKWYGAVPRLEMVWLPATTGGQAETVLHAREHAPAHEPLLIFNIDTAFSSPSLKSALASAQNDGVLGAFTSSEPRFSFAATDETGTVTRVAEKVPISDQALTGLYHFRRAGDFFAVADHAVRLNQRVKGEFYVAPLYNELIAQGHRYVIDSCAHHYILGTPEEYKAFLATPRERVTRELLAGG